MTAKLLGFLAGKKTYLVGVAGVIYSLGIYQQWWPSETEIWAGLGCTGGMTLRAAIAKLCTQVSQTKAAPKRPRRKSSGAARRQMTSTVDLPAMLCIAMQAGLIMTMTGCASTGEGGSSVADRASTFANSRAGQALEAALINAALGTAQQYLDTGTVDPKKVLANSLDGAAQSLRSLAGTQLVESPKAIADSVAIGTGVRAMENTVAPIVAAQVSRLIQDGTHPDQAIEHLATVMNKGAASARKVRKRSDRDYALFEKWLQGVYEIAPRYNLELHPGAKDEEEFFYLQCWQSGDHSPENCVRRAKRAWARRPRPHSLPAVLRPAMQAGDTPQKFDADGNPNFGAGRK